MVNEVFIVRAKNALTSAKKGRFRVLYSLSVQIVDPNCKWAVKKGLKRQRNEQQDFHARYL